MKMYARVRHGSTVDVDVSNGIVEMSSFSLQDCNSTVVSVASKLAARSTASAAGANDRFYDEYEYERKVKKRRARLITAAEEAFTHIKRMRQDQFGTYMENRLQRFGSTIKAKSFQ